MAPITLDEVLNLKYLETWSWSPDGKFIGYILDDGGQRDVWVVDPASGEEAQVSAAKRAVSSFTWHPSEVKIVYVADGNLMTAAYDGGSWKSKALTQTADRESTPVYSPDGRYLCFIRNGEVWMRDEDTHAVRSFSPRKAAVVPRSFGSGEAVGWSPRSDLLYYNFRDTDGFMHVGVSSPAGTLLWRSTWRDGPVAGLSWVADRKLLLARHSDRGLVREFCVVEIPSDVEDTQTDIASGNFTAAPSTVQLDERVIYRQEARGTPGDLRVSGAWCEPSGDRILLISEDDGWAHLYMSDLLGAEAQQMTFGECEDFGHMGDEPAWSPDGRYVCYASNRGSSGERQLWILDTEEGASRQLTDFEGTNVQPKWSPDGSQIAFVHCDPYRSADLWILPFDPSDLASPVTEVRQLIRTMPLSWTPDKCIVAEEVTYEGAQDWTIHGYLMTPPTPENDSTKYPALVWVHGGPIRQMRHGFHPSRSYAFFYALSQYLAHRGYATLMINFRGGIGYGREFRNGLFRKMAVDDVVDVVSGGQYLKSLPSVDEERVGVWGISYGGYMTLAALTQYPEEFRMGINIAGIWDFAQWNQWIREEHGRQMGGFEVFFDGSPEENPEQYRIGSPCTHRDGLQRPLINFHGTADANVDFAQMDRIVKDCLQLGREYEAYYYPDEVHMFAHRRTWADAVVKIERELEKHLKS